MLKDLKNDEHGVVFVTVLIIIITTMVLAISALSLNISQIRSAETELRYIQCKALVDGGLVQILSTQFTATPEITNTYVETLGNTTFTIQSDINVAAGPPGPLSDELIISCTF